MKEKMEIGKKDVGSATELFGKIDLNLKKFQQDEYEGEIVGVSMMTLGKWLKKKAHPLTLEQAAKWSNLDRLNVCITIKSGAKIVTTQFMIPDDAGGYQRTNLKKFKDINGLPDHIADWGGKKIKLKLGKQGFLDVAL